MKNLKVFIYFPQCVLLSLSHIVGSGRGDDMRATPSCTVYTPAYVHVAAGLYLPLPGHLWASVTHRKTPVHFFKATVRQYGSSVASALL